MPDAPACLAAIADYLTFLARYPSLDALYWDCRHGWFIVPVALAGGWPRAGLSLGRAVFRGVLAALVVLMPLNLYWGFPVPVCEGLTALTLLSLFLAGPVSALAWLVPRRPVVASLLVLVAATLVFPCLRGDWGYLADSAMLTALLAGLGIGVPGCPAAGLFWRRGWSGLRPFPFGCACRRPARRGSGMIMSCWPWRRPC